MSSVAKLIVRQHRPYFYVAILIGAIALTFLIQRYLYLQETQIQQQHIKECKQQDGFYQQLRKKNEEMSTYISRSDTQLENNKYELDLQKATIEQLEQQLSLQQEQLAAFNKELLFYETITQGDRPNKLQIRELLLRSDATDSAIIHYRLVITQGKKINQALTGTIEMIGNISKEESSVIAEHPLNLRHVQLIEGQIKILDNNEPESITITIKQKKKTLLSQSFDWQLNPPSE
ncbi:MAG: hypothetical protein COA83_06360 [Methylophaga sp.]|nr:MAG: hypothetical protein COA83_06360 [Methylophaga sp.]